MVINKTFDTKLRKVTSTFFNAFGSLWFFYTTKPLLLRQECEEVIYGRFYKFVFYALSIDFLLG